MLSLKEWIQRMLHDRRVHSAAPKVERRSAKPSRMEVDQRVHSALDDIEQTLSITSDEFRRKRE